VAGAEAEGGDEVRRILLGEGLDCGADDLVAYEGLAGRITAAPPDLLLVYCNPAKREALAAIQTAQHLFPGPILAVGESNVTLMREVLRAGARELLDVNNLRQDLSTALVSIENSIRQPSQRGQIVSVFSPCGGAGVSTIAVNLAVALAEIRPRGSADTIALLDVTEPPSDLSLLLDLQPQHVMAEVCRHAERLDRSLLAGAMTAHASGVQVLPQAGYADESRRESEKIDPAVIRQLLVLLRRMHTRVVVDIGHVLGDVQVETLRLSNLLILVAHGDVPGLRRVRWALDRIAAAGVARGRVRLVLNRYTDRYHVKRAQVEEALGMPVAVAFPDDTAAVTRARNEGVPLAELSGKAKIVSLFTALAREVQQHVARPAL
jgi:Flp pilus assembly CpaE family ATPase